MCARGAGSTALPSLRPSPSRRHPSQAPVQSRNMIILGILVEKQRCQGYQGIDYMRVLDYIKWSSGTQLLKRAEFLCWTRIDIFWNSSLQCSVFRRRTSYSKHSFQVPEGP